MVRSRLTQSTRTLASVLGSVFFAKFGTPLGAQTAAEPGCVVNIRRPIFLLTALATIAALAACGSSKKIIAPPPPISVAFSTTSAPPSSMLTDAQVRFAAEVNNDSFNDGVTWSVSCGSTVAGACGAFVHPATGSDIDNTYVAPTQVPTGNTVTVTATSVSDTTKSVQATITVAAPLTVAFTPSTIIPSSLLTSTQTTLAVVVTNDPANAGAAWSVTCGSTGVGACGTLSATTTASGGAITYTAPSAVPTNSAVTITAASVTDPTKLVQAIIPIAIISVTFNRGTATTYNAPAVAPTGTFVTVTATSVTDPTKSVQASISISVPALADGTYVFSLSGIDKATAQPYFVAGVFTVSGGSITSGEQDFHDLKSPPAGQNDLINPASSSVSNTADGNVQVALAACNGTDCTSSDSGVGVNGVETFNGTKVTTSHYRLVQFDIAASSSGTMDLQTSIAAPAGGYAFIISGIDHNALPLAMGGVINVDGPGTISGTGSVFDYNDASIPAHSTFSVILADQSFFPSTVSSPDSFGRVVFNLTPSNFLKLSGLTFAGYIVDATHIRLVEINDSIGAFTGGTALGQGTSTGSFTSASISPSLGPTPSIPPAE